MSGASNRPADDRTIARARELRDQGLTYVQIATRLGYSVGTIRKLCLGGNRTERDPRANWKTAAKRIGITLEAYTARREQGERWCTICRTWKHEAYMKPEQSQCVDCKGGAGKK